MFLNNTYMSFNIIRHMNVMYPLTTYMWSLCNIVLHILASITPFVALSADQSLVWWAYQFLVSSKHFNCAILTPWLCHPGRIWINAQRSKACSRGQPRSLTITSPRTELRATLLRFPAPPISVTLLSRSALPLRLLAVGSALSWVHAVLRQMEGCHVLSHLGRRETASTSLGCRLHPQHGT